MRRTYAFLRRFCRTTEISRSLLGPICLTITGGHYARRNGLARQVLGILMKIMLHANHRAYELPNVAVIVGIAVVTNPNLRYVTRPVLRITPE